MQLTNSPFSKRKLLVLLALWLVVLGGACVTLYAFQRYSTRLIQRIELLPASRYDKAQLLYRQAERGYAAVLKQAEAANRDSSRTVTLSADDEVLTKTVALYVDALALDPTAPFDKSRMGHYERLAQIYDICGLGYKRFESLACALLCDKKYKLAEAYAGVSAAANAGNPDAWTLLIDVYIGLGGYNYANIAVTQAQKTGVPQHVIQMYNGKIALAKQDYQSAKECFIESLQFEPAQNYTRQLLADTLETMKETTAAASMLEDGIGHGVESSPTLLHRIAATYAIGGDYEKATKYFDMCIAIEPKAASVRWDYAQMLQKMNAPKYKINAQLQTAFALNPDYKLKHLTETE